MLKVIVKTINTITAVYVMYIVGSTIYTMGKEAGKKETAEIIPFSSTGTPDDNSAYRIVDNILYKRVDK